MATAVEAGLKSCVGDGLGKGVEVGITWRITVGWSVGAGSVMAAPPAVGVIVRIGVGVVGGSRSAQAIKSKALKKNMKCLIETFGIVQFVLDLAALKNVRQ